MATSEYVQWFERGRAHQFEGRPLDAMLCFRRAARAEPRASDPHFVLGEVLWQLGRLSDAIAAWRESTRLSPSHLAPAQALAEALLATGDWTAAEVAAERVLAIAPDEPRAALIRAIASVRSEPAESARSLGEIEALLVQAPSYLAVPALAGPLATVLDRALPGGAREALLDGLARRPEQLVAAPGLLVALVVERLADTGNRDALDPWIVQTGARAYGAGEREPLRRIAVALAEFDPGAAASLCERYAQLCAAAFAPPVPLLWPRRTAARRCRVIVLAAADDATIEAFAALSHNAFDVAFAVFGATEPPSIAGHTAIALPEQPDVAAARAIALRDADVLVDLVGATRAGGPVLASKPARAIWTLATLPLPHRAPLVDRICRDVSDATAALSALAAEADSGSDCPLDATALQAAWEGAVRTHQSGDAAAALAQYDAVLGLQPGAASVLFLSGVARRDVGDVAGARERFLSAVAVAPAYVDARVAAARAALSMGDAEAAVALCEDGLARASDARLARTLGDAQVVRRDGVAAAVAFASALALDPNDAEAHYGQGVALQMQRRHGDAARAYQRALTLRPALTAAHFNLGVLFQEQGATDAAIAAYREVLAIEPDNVSAHKNLCETLQGAGRIDEWLASFRRFEERCPNALPLAVQALEACQHRGDFAALDRYLGGLAEERFVARDEAELVDSLEQLLFLLLYFDVSTETMARYAELYDGAARRVYGPPLPSLDARRAGRLRIGYLSGDLRDHVMGKMMWAAVERHDRERFELHFYSLSDKSDEWTAKFRDLADRFEVVAALDPRAAAAQIAAADLDLLVDLSTHTKGAQPGILALKPARVQITHVASAGTVGLSTVDFKLTDRFCDVPEAQAFQVETLLPMDGCVYPYRHVAVAGDHPFQRATFGVAESAFVIAAFVNPLKLSRRCLELWRQVLARIPRARLAFSPLSPAIRGAYERLAAAAGIDAARLVFLPQGRDEAEGRARYSLVDLALDPLPYGGANGTLEALDAGVPVVTLVGRRHGERTSYSMLTNLGVQDTIAASGREYIEVAARLAENSAFMRDVRARIRAGIAHSPLTDMTAHTRALERAYLAALAAKAPEALADAEQARNG
jgi:protein O-GlcNAc transferase